MLPHVEPLKLDAFFTVKQADEFLGVPAATLRNWDRSGRLKATRHPVNGYRLYRREQLRVFLQNVAAVGSDAKNKENRDH